MKPINVILLHYLQYSDLKYFINDWINKIMYRGGHNNQKTIFFCK